jgi:hypothetical protein
MSNIEHLVSDLPEHAGHSKYISAGVKLGMVLNNTRQRDRSPGPEKRFIIRDVAESIGRSLGIEAVELGLKHVVKRSLAHEAGKQVTRQVVKHGTRHVFKGVLRANVVTAAACFVVDQGIDTARLAAGRIDRKEFKKRSAENTGGALGGVGGAVTGAAIGTALCPGIGTTIGGIVGGLLGGLTAAVGSGEIFSSS